MRGENEAEQVFFFFSGGGVGICLANKHLCTAKARLKTDVSQTTVFKNMLKLTQQDKVLTMINYIQTKQIQLK